MAGPSKAGAKRETVSEIAGSFRASSAAVLTEYRGLTVAEVTQLRRALGAQTTYTVVKNTLTKIAAQQAGVEGLDALLTGPTAVAFVTGDPVEAAKALRAFGREHPFLVVKGGVLDGKALTPAEIQSLADLESREVLLAKLAGAMNATTAKAAALFQAPLAQAARLVEALRAKAEADPSVLRGGAGVPETVPETSADPDAVTAAAAVAVAGGTGAGALDASGSGDLAAVAADSGETGDAGETAGAPATDDATTAAQALAVTGGTGAGTDVGTATASEPPAVTLTVDEAVSLEAGGAAPPSNADAPDEADTSHGAGVDTA